MHLGVTMKWRVSFRMTGTPVSYVMGTGDSFSGSKAAGA
jgi:hypothetical protein